MNQFVIYTDLDGTLLNHETYSADAARPTLALLKKAGIPVIPVTSKTRAELELIRQDLGLNTPFIVENGAAVFIPIEWHGSDLTGVCDFKSPDGHYLVKTFSPGKQYWQEIASELIQLVPNAFTAFSELTSAQIAELTGLDLESAVLAGTREYSNPFYWHGSQKQYDDMVVWCREKAIKVVRGGRFVHLLHSTVSKGNALNWFHQSISGKDNQPVTSIALGDGENDIDMLLAATIAVQVRSPAHSFPDVGREDVIQTELYGPEGWSQAIQQLISFK